MPAEQRQRPARDAADNIVESGEAGGDEGQARLDSTGRHEHARAETLLQAGAGQVKAGMLGVGHIPSI